ncbi:hypothetical protein SAMN04488691_103152 [Haloferax larsenii]|uniref:Uncharacterized protein n=1 Tax=Haloferax larsenii TaxID=302484 RepID=A0A1H7MZU7_HALLR|nr:hypothetical protein SAMN04488691_103152 [Haloferax larsenii]
MSLPIPEVIVVGDIELLFLGMAVAAGMPRVARRILEQRYGSSDEDSGNSGSTSVPCEDCPTPADCAALGCRKEMQE